VWPSYSQLPSRQPRPAAVSKTGSPQSHSSTTTPEGIEKGGLTARAVLAGEVDATGRGLDGEVALAVRAAPDAVEPVADGGFHRVARGVETEVERLAALDPDLRKLAVLADPVGDARTGGESPASLAVETDHVAPRAHEYPTVLRAGADRESGFGNRERAAGGRLLGGDDSEPAGAVAGGDREAVRRPQRRPSRDG